MRNGRHSVLSVRAALALAAITTMVGFACGRPNPTDAALGQVMQEARDDLEKSPDPRDIRILNLTRGAQAAMTGKSMEPDNNRLDAYIEDPNEPPPESQKFELEAIALAQEGELALLSGDDEGGLAKLEASMKLHPTLDALRVLGPELSKRAAVELLQSYCEGTFRVQRQDAARLAVLDLCRAQSDTEALHEALPWASDETLIWYEVQLVEPVP